MKLGFLLEIRCGVGGCGDRRTAYPQIRDTEFTARDPHGMSQLKSVKQKSFGKYVSEISIQPARETINGGDALTFDKCGGEF
jgi:hypothetical protein